ncbi:MAG: CHAT domain-containing protein [Bacteroidetes bacterium]|nr:CHAT domain-containing protein [Bacteroidota bacterium]MDA1122243.1 CHAT domain-containing protein [Bacteroidota bacterium]
MVAGAEAVVMTLWKVDDAATQELMNNFYGLWLDGIELKKVSRSAQVELRKKYPSPYFWGRIRNHGWVLGYQLINSS